MRKFLLTLTAVIALTAASKAMIVYAEEMAMEPEAVVAEESAVTNEMMNEMNAMSNEVVNEITEAVEAGSPEAGSTY